MSYRIDYQGPKKMRGMEKRTVSAPALTGLCLLAFLVLTCALWPRGADALRELMIPGDAAVTVGALEELAAEVGAGESVKEAFQGFCRRVMDAAA